LWPAGGGAVASGGGRAAPPVSWVFVEGGPSPGSGACWAWSGPAGPLARPGAAWLWSLGPVADPSPLADGYFFFLSVVPRLACSFVFSFVSEEWAGSTGPGWRGTRAFGGYADWTCARGALCGCGPTNLLTSTAPPATSAVTVVTVIALAAT